MSFIKFVKENPSCYSFNVKEVVKRIMLDTKTHEEIHSEIKTWNEQEHHNGIAEALHIDGLIHPHHEHHGKLENVNTFIIKPTSHTNLLPKTWHRVRATSFSELPLNDPSMQETEGQADYDN